MQKQEFKENFPLDIGGETAPEPQWFQVSGRLGERIHPIGPKFTAGYVFTDSLAHAKESYQAYFAQYFEDVEVLQVTPAGARMPRGHVFPAKRKLQ